MASMETRQTILLAYTVPASGDSNAAGATQVEFPVLRACKVTGLLIRFYPGPELSLQLTPYVRYQQERQGLVPFAPSGKQYIDGDDDIIPFEVDMPARMGSYIGIGYLNTDATNAYDFRVYATLYFGGHG